MNSLDCARELLSRGGADPNLLTPWGDSPLRAAIHTVDNHIIEYLELLIEYGARLDPQLLFAPLSPRSRHGEVVTRFLLDRGIDPNITSIEWGTPLHHAIRSAKPVFVKMLLDAGADPTAISIGRRVGSETLMECAERIMFEDTRDQIMKLLREASAEAQST